MKDYDLLVIGEINPDLILKGTDVFPVFGQAEKLVEGATLTIGSSSVITACGAARLGLRVAFIGLVGDDLFGRYMLSAMQERGLDTSACIIDPAITTGVSIILSTTDDRAILTYPGSITLLTREMIDHRMLAKARHLHLGSYFLLDALRPDIPGIFAAARAQGLTTSLDTNWDPREIWDVAAILPHCDIFFPNREEVTRITGQDSFELALSDLANQVPTLAVKLGAAGGLARCGPDTTHAPSLAVEVIDTTGAGDSFDAGFLFGHLNGFTVGESLRLACVCGSLSTRAAGGTAAQPTWAEIKALDFQIKEN